LCDSVWNQKAITQDPHSQHEIGVATSSQDQEQCDVETPLHAFNHVAGLQSVRQEHECRELRNRAKIKSLQMAVVIVSTFIICSTPYHLLELVYSYGSHDLVPELVAGALLTPFLFSRGGPFRCRNIISFNASGGVNIMVAARE